MTTSPSDLSARVHALGHYINESRKYRGLSLDALSAKARVSRLTILNIELGRSDPRLTTVLTLLDAMEIEIAIQGEKL
jgi:DNA-binding XRE family transcriptional regulator